MKIELRKAAPDDFLLLSELGAKTFYETWRPVNTEEDMQLYMKKAFDPGTIKKDIESSTVNTFLIAFSDNTAIGYLKMRQDRTYDEFNNSRAIEVERIYVLKIWQDKKIGKLLMDKSIELASEENYKWIWLGVNIDNHKAIEFYKRYHFIIFGEKAFQLGEAVDNDYLMKLELP